MRARVQGLAVLLAAGFAGLLFAPVFDPAGPLVRACLLVLVPVALADVVLGRRHALRLLVAVAGGLLVVVEVVLRAGVPTAGTGRALLAGASDAWARTLDTTWPVRPDPELVVFVPLLVLAAAVLGVELLRRTPYPALALVPGLAVAALAQAYAAQGERASAALAGAYAVPVVLLLVTSRRGTGRPSVRRAGVVLLSIGIGVAALTVADPAGRPAFSLKDRRQAELLPAAAVSPLSQVAERLRRPQTVVFEDRTSAPVDRWPLAVLDRFDGQAWTSSARYQPFGGELPVDPAVTVPTARYSAVLKLASLRGPWLPAQARTTAVDGVRPFVDPATGTLLSDVEVGAAQYRLTWSAPRPSTSDLSRAALDFGAMPGWDAPAPPAGIADLARTATAGHTPSVTTALQLEKWLRQTYDPATGGTPPTGHGYPQVSYFLQESKRGTSEQFAAAYVVLARAVGIPARLVVGFRQPGEPDAQGTYVVRNRDVLAWPEIAVSGIGWVPLDPTAKAGGRPASGNGLAEATAAARKALPPPDQVGPEETDPTPGPAVATAPEPGGRLPLLLALPALLVLLFAAVPLAKAVRRRRRRSASPEAAVVGGWREVRDRLADHGLPAPPGATPRELAESARPLLGDRSAALDRLGGHLDTALWSGRSADAPLAAAVWSEVDGVRRALARRPVRSRLAAAASVRTLLPDQDRGASNVQAAPRTERASL